MKFVSHIDLLHTHRHWEDWFNFLLGLLVIASPLALGPLVMPVVLNAFVVGLLICSVSALEVSALQTWEEWLNFALGVWLVASPSVLGYVRFDEITAAHYGLGALIAGLAIFEYWQDSHQAKR